ncbi:hypothetical protein KCU93_g4875, partial [Aureobasidium melanogenum]
MSYFYCNIRHRQRWGFVIYRTDYSSEEDWTKLKIMINTWSKDEYKTSEEATLIQSWQNHWWFDDQSQFDNPSVAQLRKHFKETWVPSLSERERSRGWPEQLMFFVVDKEVLDSVRPHSINLSEHCGEYPYIKAWDSDVPAADDSGYPGWMNVNVPTLLNLYETAIFVGAQDMRALRSRSTDYFSSQRVWVEDDHYGDQEEEIDAVSDAAEGSN